MTTTFHDLPTLVEALDRNPEYREKLRGQPADSAPTPSTNAADIAALTATVDTIAAKVDQLSDKIDATNARVDETIARMDKATTEMAENTQAVKRLTSQMERRDQDTATLKGWQTEEKARRRPGVIVHQLGLTFRRTLTDRDLRQMMAPHQKGIPTSKRESFEEADLVIEAEDPQGNTTYVAVEASFTGNPSDVNRAVEHAEYLTRFTGCPALAVVASVKNHPSIHNDIAEGTVSWHRIKEKEFLNN